MIWHVIGRAMLALFLICAGASLMSFGEIYPEGLRGNIWLAAGVLCLFAAFNVALGL